MDMSLLKNKIMYITVFLATIVCISIGFIWFFLSKENYSEYILSSLNLQTIRVLVLALTLMLITTLILPTTIISYLTSYFGMHQLIFFLNRNIFGDIGNKELIRVILYFFAIFAAIVWVQIAKKIREKV